MKKLFVTAVLLISLTAFAQERKRNQKEVVTVEKITPEQRTEKHLQNLTTKLNLSSVQREQIKVLISERDTKRRENKIKREERKANQSQRTQEERQEFKKIMLEEKEAMENKMNTILSKEQYEKWESLRKKNKSKMTPKKRK